MQQCQDCGDTLTPREKLEYDVIFAGSTIPPFCDGCVTLRSCELLLKDPLASAYLGSDVMQVDVARARDRVEQAVRSN
jgi:hypothetical protein